MRVIGEIVANLNEQPIMEYKPKPTIVDFVANFWLKHFDTKQLLSFPVDSFEEYCKETLLKSQPDLSEESLNNFASDTVFHLSFRLSKQGRWTDDVTGKNK
jgi:hypothetical protein